MLCVCVCVFVCVCARAAVLLALSVFLISPSLHPFQATLSETEPAPARTETCEPVTEEGVARLFDEWNSALVNGTADDVVDRYWAKGSVLLATLEAEPLVTPEQKKGYFEEFQAKKPSGKINERLIELGCNTATDAGIYTCEILARGKRENRGEKRTGLRRETRANLPFHQPHVRLSLTLSHPSLPLSVTLRSTGEKERARARAREMER